MIIKPRLKPNMAPIWRMKRITCHPPIFSGWTLGSEPGGQQEAQRWQRKLKKRKRQSPTETSLQPLHSLEECIVRGTFQNVT